MRGISSSVTAILFTLLVIASIGALSMWYFKVSGKVLSSQTSTLLEMQKSVSAILEVDDIYGASRIQTCGGDYIGVVLSNLGETDVTVTRVVISTVRGDFVNTSKIKIPSNGLYPVAVSLSGNSAEDICSGLVKLEVYSGARKLIERKLTCDHLTKQRAYGTWKYRVIVTVNNTYFSDIGGARVLIVLDTSSLILSGKVRTDCSDIVVTDEYGKILNYWIERGTCNSTATGIWVKIPELKHGKNTVYLLYGGRIADIANASKVFDYFDDFDTDTSSNYERIFSEGVWNTSVGEVQIYGNNREKDILLHDFHTNLENYTVIGRFLIKGGNCSLRLIFRYNTSTDYYEYERLSRGSVSTVTFYYPGGGSTVSVPAPSGYETFMVIADNATFDFYLNNQLVASNKNTAVKSGRVGFYMGPGISSDLCNATIDYFTVTNSIRWFEISMSGEEEGSYSAYVC